MKIYLFNECDGKITKYIYEVYETEKLYKVKRGFFKTFFTTQIKKSEVNTIKNCGYFGFSMVSEDDNFDVFYNKIIEISARRFKEAESVFLQQKELYEKLRNREYDFVEKTMEGDE